ncbi:MAG: hypothetical protein KAS05_01975 [Candidatus Omnitrophica bacterium]|nr:hypothetical protein [Candidatus Omnitrophota bacterium]
MKKIFLLTLLSFLLTSTISADINLKPSFLWKKLMGPSKEEETLKKILGIKAVIKEDPENYADYEALSIAYDRIGLYEKSIAALKTAIKYYPEDENDEDFLYGNLARAYIIIKELDKAKDALDKAMKINPNNAVNAVHLAQYHIMKKQYKQAASAMKRDSDLSNKEDIYFDWYRYIFFDLGIDSSKAIDLFKYVVELDPKSNDARRTFATAIRGDLDNLENDFSRIIEEYKKALNCRPNHVLTHICIADTYMFMAFKTKDESYNEIALEWFGKAFEINPKHEQLFYAIANFYNYNEKHDEAILKLKEAILLGFNDEHMMETLARAYNNKAYSLYQEGKDLNKGLEVIEKAISLSPNNGIILSTKAELLYKMGKFEEAYTYIKRGIILEPEHLEIQQDFKMIEEALGKANK